MPILPISRPAPPSAIGSRCAMRRSPGCIAVLAAGASHEGGSIASSASPAALRRGSTAARPVNRSAPHRAIPARSRRSVSSVGRDSAACMATSGNSFVAVVDSVPSRRASLGGVGGRREWRSGLGALRRSGRAVRQRRSATDHPRCRRGGTTLSPGRGAPHRRGAHGTACGVPSIGQGRGGWLPATSNRSSAPRIRLLISVAASCALPPTMASATVLCSIALARGTPL